MFKKLSIALILVISGLFVLAKPASAVCQTVKVEGAGYVYVKTVCTGSGNYNNVVIARSTTGNATAIVRTFNFINSNIFIRR